MIKEQEFFEYFKTLRNKQRKEIIKDIIWIDHEILESVRTNTREFIKSAMVLVEDLSEKTNLGNSGTYNYRAFEFAIYYTRTGATICLASNYQTKRFVFITKKDAGNPKRYAKRFQKALDELCTASLLEA